MEGVAIYLSMCTVWTEPWMWENVSQMLGPFPPSPAAPSSCKISFSQNFVKTRKTNCINNTYSEWMDLWAGQGGLVIMKLELPDKQMTRHQIWSPWGSCFYRDVEKLLQLRSWKDKVKANIRRMSIDPEF